MVFARWCWFVWKNHLSALKPITRDHAIRMTVLSRIGTGACIVAVCAAAASGQDHNINEVCASNRAVFGSIDMPNDGQFIYYEVNPGSPSSPATFEYWRDGQRLWDAQAHRGCSQGVSRCHVRLPYLVDGEAFDVLKVEMNAFTMPDGQHLVVFSHLTESILQLYAKDMPERDVALTGDSYFGTSYPRKKDMLLPSVFVQVDCTVLM